MVPRAVRSEVPRSPSRSASDITARRAQSEEATLSPFGAAGCEAHHAPMVAARALCAAAARHAEPQRCRRSLGTRTGGEPAVHSPGAGRAARAPFSRGRNDLNWQICTRAITNAVIQPCPDLSHGRLRRHRCSPGRVCHSARTCCLNTNTNGFSQRICVEVGARACAELLGAGSALVVSPQSG
jgi:hypothetical protein